ncbi:MAG TPA: hypothetical protein IAA75_03080 [Candidatus Pullichristensenella avicola]|nr:hypothetical protein [Candidatus Pullichristensenella avicola]
MSLKDLLNSVTGRNRERKPAESAPPAALPSDCFPILRACEVELEKYEKLPLSGLAALGAAFATLPEAARTIVQTVTTGVDTGEMLFTAINPKAATGFLRMGAYGTSGNIVNSKGVITGRMRFQPVERLPVTQTTTTIMPFNPAAMAIAVAILRIEEKLDALQKTAEETLQFLKLDKQSKQRGNLNALSDILEEYRRNGSDTSFRALRNVDVQAIRREAQQNMLFYQEQVARRLQEQGALHDSQAVRGMLNAVADEFREYQLACYLYAFSTFLDVVLQGRFDEESLKAVSEKLQTYAQRYTHLYEQCLAQLENYQKSAFDVWLRDGLGNVARSVGKALSNVPILRDGPVDEALTHAGDQLKHINESDLGACLRALEPLRDHRMAAFAENVAMLNHLCNDENALLTDGTSLYLRTA